MVSLRDGKTVGPDNNKAAKPLEPKKLPAKVPPKKEQKSSLTEGKKRKATDPPPEENDEACPPSTPKSQGPQLSSEPKAEPEEHEKTPGRIGSIKRKKFGVRPDIKPFKGPKGQKVRKTALEKSKEYTQFCLENEDDSFHELHVCYEKGPNGSPTCDESGFELDYDKVADWMKPMPYNKGRMVRGMEKALEKRDHDRKRMAEIFFEKGEAPTSDSPNCFGKDDFWRDRVSKDLNVPWHNVGVEQFEEWERRGFKKARKGEYENFSDAEKARMATIQVGSALRK